MFNGKVSTGMFSNPSVEFESEPVIHNDEVSFGNEGLNIATTELDLSSHVYNCFYHLNTPMCRFQL
jgi:hypothetical protein